MSVSSALRQIFVIARVFDMVQFANYEGVLIAVIEVARYHQQELSNLLPIGHLPAQSINRNTRTTFKTC